LPKLEKNTEEKVSWIKNNFKFQGEC
jgi:hypothetical protein